MKLFEEGELELPIDDHINSLIMSQASDIAERLTYLDCRINNILCEVIEIENGVEVSMYTEEAQDIYNIYYDEQVTELYGLLNAQLKAIQENK